MLIFSQVSGGIFVKELLKMIIFIYQKRSWKSINSWGKDFFDWHSITAYVFNNLFVIVCNAGKG